MLIYACALTNNAIPAGKWTHDDVHTLLDRIEKHFDKPTMESYITTLKRVDWDEIKFGPYTAEDCKKLGNELVMAARRFRMLREVTEDIKSNLNKKCYTKLISQTGLQEKAPKRPATAYLLYHTERLKAMKRQSPGKKIKVIAKVIAEEWRQMPEKKKSKYVSHAQDLKKNYQEKKTELGLDEVPPPKRPISAVARYINHKIKGKQFSTSEEKKATKMKYKEKFKELSNEKKRKFFDEYEQAMKDYVEQYGEYAKMTPHLKHKTRIPGNVKRIKLEQDADRSPKPPQTPQQLYIGKKMCKMEVKDDECKKVLMREYNALPDDKKLRWIRKAELRPNDVT